VKYVQFAIAPLMTVYLVIQEELSTVCCHYQWRWL